ncbi:hypothetical protein P8452_32537 [Trifolium repens]|nr:hypothetical protein P8452_32537 [Trifolium repens]
MRGILKTLAGSRNITLANMLKRNSMDILNYCHLSSFMSYFHEARVHVSSLIKQRSLTKRQQGLIENMRDAGLVWKMACFV